MFYVEASVLNSNVPSQRLAEKVFGASKQSGFDEQSGEALKLYRILLGKKPFEV